MNLNPNVQAKVLSLEEMEKMNHTCVAKICSLFHKNIARIKFSETENQLLHEQCKEIARIISGISQFTDILPSCF